MLNKRYSFQDIFNDCTEGACLHEILYDAGGNPKDYIIRDINLSFETIIGYSRNDILNKVSTEAYNCKSPPYFEKYFETATSGNPHSFETYYEPMNKYFKIKVFSPEKNWFITVFSDITENINQKRENQKDKRLKDIFSAMTEVNRIILRSADKKVMCDDICKTLVSTGRYQYSWIALYDVNGEFYHFSYSGEDISFFEKDLIKNFWPNCMKYCFSENYNVVLDNSSFCLKCLLGKKNHQENHGSIITKLSQENCFYGFLAVNLNSYTLKDDVEKDFILKIVSDICQGFKNIENRDEKNIYLNEIVEYSNELTAIYNNVPLMIMVVDRNMIIHKVNSYTAHKFNKNLEYLHGQLVCNAISCTHFLDDHDNYCSFCNIKSCIEKTFDKLESVSQCEGDIEFFSENKARKKVLISTDIFSFSLEDLVLLVIEDITKLAQQRMLLEHINSVSGFIIKGTPFEGVVNHIIGGLFKLLPHLRCSYLVKNQNNLKVLKSCEPFSLNKIENFEFSFAEINFLLNEFLEGILKSDNICEDNRFLRCEDKFKKFGITSFLSVEVRVGEELKGFLSFDSSEIVKWGQFEEDLLKESASLIIFMLRQMDAELKKEQVANDLLKREKAFRDIFNNSPVGIFRVACDGTILNANSEMARILGYSNHNDFLMNYGNFFKDFIFCSNKTDDFFQTINKYGKAENFVFQVKTKSRSSIWLEISAARSTGFSKDRLCLEGFAKDVSSEYMAEQNLKLSREKFSKIFYKSHAVMAITNFDSGKYIDVNNAFLHLTGYERKYILGKTSTETGTVSLETRNKILKLLKTNKKVHEVEIIFFTKDEEKKCVLYSAELIEINSEKKILSTIFDITERKQIYQEALRSAQLASIGELAAGVAHEINNPINGIINYGELLKDDFQKIGFESELPQRIIREGDRIAAIVNKLLIFARERKEQTSVLDLYHVLRESIYLAEVQMRREGIVIINEFPENFGYIKGRLNEIQQVFLNILSNARYALNEKYENTDINKVLRIYGEKLNKNGKKIIRIVFFDSGSGIPIKYIHKIQEPFFSTKPAGKGTGLGLSLSSRIIDAHGGHIFFETVENEFTKVIIEFLQAK